MRWDTNGATVAVSISVENTAPVIYGSAYLYKADLLSARGDEKVGTPVAAMDREGGPLTFSLQNLNMNLGANSTPPHSDRCSESTCTDGVFKIDSHSGQIRTEWGKTYTQSHYRVRVTATDSQGLSGSTSRVWINLDRNPSPAQHVAPGAATGIQPVAQPTDQPMQPPAGAATAPSGAHGSVVQF